MNQSRSRASSGAWTQLGNQRTFLASLRSGLALVALGLTFAEFLRGEPDANVPLVRASLALVAGTGMILVAVCVLRFVRGLDPIHESHRRANSSLVVAAVAAMAAGSLAFGWLLSRG